MSHHGLTLFTFWFMVQWFSSPTIMTGFTQSAPFGSKKDCMEVVRTLREQKNPLISVTDCFEGWIDVWDKTPGATPPAALSYDPKAAPAHPEQ